jgi:hypothetical protein
MSITTITTTNVIESQFSDDNNNNNNLKMPERRKRRRNSAAASYHDHSHDVSFFQICQSCFWCSSILYATRMIKVCPVCTSEGIDSLPISPNEVYTYDLSESAGVSLSFASLNSRR